MEKINKPNVMQDRPHPSMLRSSPHRRKNHTTPKFLTIAALALLTAWAIGFFIYDLGLAVHFLLLAATSIFIIKALIEK